MLTNTEHSLLNSKFLLTGFTGYWYKDTGFMDWGTGTLNTVSYFDNSRLRNTEDGSKPTEFHI